MQDVEKMNQKMFYGVISPEVNKVNSFANDSSLLKLHLDITF